MAICEIVLNQQLQGDYYRVIFDAPAVAQTAQPGQFVHVRIDRRQDQILRRPFSIHDADGRFITVVYKVVGKGTAVLSQLQPGETCDLIGKPLGRPYTLPDAHTVPVLVCGGYGSAATYMIAKRSAQKAVLLLGARSQGDLILTKEYADCNCDVRLATDDGSAGLKGRVTALLPQLLEDYAGKKLFFYACGPLPMLNALGVELRKLGLPGELSVDHRMCCGIGSCFACVVKVNDPASPDGWKYARACVEGPVFNLDELYLEKGC